MFSFIVPLFQLLIIGNSTAAMRAASLTREVYLAISVLSTLSNLFNFEESLVYWLSNLLKSRHKEMYIHWWLKPWMDPPLCLILL